MKKLKGVDSQTYFDGIVDLSDYFLREVLGCT